MSKPTSQHNNWIAPYTTLAEQLFNTSSLSPAAENALRLHDAGLTVFPLPYRCKAHTDISGAKGFSHSLFDRTRLLREDIPHAFAGLCNIAVKCSNGLFVFDCETRESAGEILYQLDKQGIAPYGWWTGRGAHIVLRAARPVKSEKTRSNGISALSDMEIVGEGGYVVAVGSLHPSGKVYEWFSNCADSPPEVDIQQIDWLYDAKGKPYQIKMGAHQPGNDSREYLMKGGRIPEGQRNNSLFAASTDARNAGYSRESANRLANPARASGLTDAEIKRTIDSAYLNISKTNKPQRIDQLYQFAAKFQWRGRTGKTDRQVFEAMIERYRLTTQATGETGIRGSIREIAELALLDKATVQRSLQRLTGKDARKVYEEFIPLYVALRGHYHQPQTYRFNALCWQPTKLPDDKLRTVVHSTKKMHIVYANCHPSILSEKGALGYTGTIIYHTLLQQSHPVTLPEIAELTGFSTRQVRCALRLDGLAIQSGLIMVQTGNPRTYKGVAMTEQQIAAMLPTHIREKPEQRRQRHARERSIYACIQVLRWRETYDSHYPHYRARSLQPVNPVATAVQVANETVLTDAASTQFDATL